jgi:hypothetical protein
LENSELRELLENQQRDFRARFGRDPEPEDPFFVREDDGESIKPGDKQVIAAMSAAGIDGESIYIFYKTGIYRRDVEGFRDRSIAAPLKLFMILATFRCGATIPRSIDSRPSVEFLNRHSQLDPVVRRVHQILLGPEVPLCHLDRCVAQEQLNLFQLPAGPRGTSSRSCASSHGGRFREHPQP